MVEDDVGDDQSKSNPGEAAIVATLVENLRKSGVLDKNIAVISPYAAQVQLITSLVPNSISVKSVDGYQEEDLFYAHCHIFTKFFYKLSLNLKTSTLPGSPCKHHLAFNRICLKLSINRLHIKYFRKFFRNYLQFHFYTCYKNPNF